MIKTYNQVITVYGKCFTHNLFVLNHFLSLFISAIYSQPLPLCCGIKKVRKLSSDGVDLCKPLFPE